MDDASRMTVFILSFSMPFPLQLGPTGRIDQKNTILSSLA